MGITAAITAKGVTKKFGDFIAVDHVDFELFDNEVVGVIGPNGAGKTTFINLITGLYMPDEGALYAHGREITGLKPEVRVGMGIARTFQLVHVFDNLSVFENLGLSYYRRLEKKGVPAGIFLATMNRKDIQEHVLDTLRLLELESLKDELVGNLPLGSKKKLELAMAFMSDPRVLMLDEPFSGLGDTEIAEVTDVLKRYIRERTVLIIEHKLSRLTEIVEKLAVMHEGKIIACGDCDETLNHPEVRRVYWKIENKE
ncbi:MAG: ABC transporter ATP-binding protein [Spirochaetes bacterium]|nr:ABC transporter ATP-binding protein [Spirochaetota bacterium]